MNDDISPVTQTVSEKNQNEGGSLGSVLAIILIVILLVIGAFYVWGQRISEKNANQYVPATQ